MASLAGYSMSSVCQFVVIPVRFKLRKWSERHTLHLIMINDDGLIIIGIQKNQIKNSNGNNIRGTARFTIKNKHYELRTFALILKLLNTFFVCSKTHPTKTCIANLILIKSKIEKNNAIKWWAHSRKVVLLSPCNLTMKMFT